MKKILLMLFTAIAVCFNVYGQNDKQIMKAAKKTAKELVKEGWKPCPGAQSIELQEITAQKMQAEIDEDGVSVFLIGSAQSDGKTIDGARKTALALARNEITSAVEIEVGVLIESSVSSSEFDGSDTHEKIDASEVAKQFASNKLNNLKPIVSRYKDLPDGNKQVAIAIFYQHKKMVDEVSAFMRKDLENKLEKQHEKLDEKLGW